MRGDMATHSADRTHSKQWKAGSRRTKRAAAETAKGAKMNRPKSANRPNKVLYVRIAGEVREALDQVATLAGLSTAATVEAIASAALKHDHPFGRIVKKALAEHRKAATSHD